MDRPKKPKKAKVDRRAAWSEVAARLGGRMEEGKSAAKDRVVFEHGPWWSRLDTYTVNTGNATITYTRVRAYVLGHRGLRVRVRGRNVFDRLWAGLGFGSPPPVARELLERYVVRGKPAARVPSLFTASAFVNALLAVPSVELRVKRASRRSRKRYGQQTGVVFCQRIGVVTDVDHLAGMVEVVRCTLEALHRVGEANEEGIPRT
jgi:hypothetical protein